MDVIKRVPDKSSLLILLLNFTLSMQPIECILTPPAMTSQKGFTYNDFEFLKDSPSFFLSNPLNIDV